MIPKMAEVFLGAQIFIIKLSAGHKFVTNLIWRNILLQI